MTGVFCEGAIVIVRVSFDKEHVSLSSINGFIFPGESLQFISADQKPSLFNNASTTGTYEKKGRKAKSVNENFANSRQRYTILTVNFTGCTYSGDGTGDPPQVFILFKGKKDGRVIKDLMSTTLPGWLHIQVQECGSYREEDVIEALRKLLPVAASTRESKVIILDWFSAHRTPAVIAFVEGRGHVILWHGGGCTPFTQHSDTHVHAPAQSWAARSMIGLHFWPPPNFGRPLP